MGIFLKGSVVNELANVSTLPITVRILFNQFPATRAFGTSDNHNIIDQLLSRDDQKTVFVKLFNAAALHCPYVTYPQPSQVVTHTTPLIRNNSQLTCYQSMPAHCITPTATF
jgi:hypothetical protein